MQPRNQFIRVAKGKEFNARAKSSTYTIVSIQPIGTGMTIAAKGGQGDYAVAEYAASNAACVATTARVVMGAFSKVYVSTSSASDVLVEVA